MFKKFYFVILILFVAFPAAYAATRASDYVSANTYNNLYPYMNNTMRTQLNPGTTPTQSGAQINTLVRTNNDNTTTRRVVSRRAATSATSSATGARAGTTQSTTYAARSATTNTQPARRVSARNATGTNSSARSATNQTTATARAAQPTVGNSRRVVARGATNTNSSMMPASTRAIRNNNSSQSTLSYINSSQYNNGTETVSSSRCLADYIDCMNDYCQREDTEYNRCYCSAKLAQIDALYKSEIDRLIKELITVQGTNKWTDAEMDAYWQQTVSQYTGTNSWKNLDDALDINWADTASSVRGQQAFAMGHSYCSQHLRNCAYMQNNLRDIYRSEIARDCAAYESTLQNMKLILDSLIQAAK